MALVDLVLIMTVEPGAGGQSYMPNCAEKAIQIREHGFEGIIEVDGGINAVTAEHARTCGATLLVAGSYVFGVHGDERTARMLSLGAKIS